MSLPKRDGVNDRYYLKKKPDTDPEVLKNTEGGHPGCVGWDRKRKPFWLPDGSSESKRNALPSQPAAGSVSVQAAFEGISPMRKLLFSAMPCGGWRAGMRSAISWRST